MAWGSSPVASLTAVLGSGGTSGSMDTTGADTLFLTVSCLASDTPTVSDSKSNTWTLIRSQNDSGALVKNVLYRSDTPASVGSGHTFTVTPGTFIGVAVTAFAGGATSSILDQQNSTGSGAGASTIHLGSITPTVDNTLVITSLETSDGVDASSINQSFTIATHVAAGGSNFGAALAYLVQTTAAAVDPTWTNSGGSNYLAANIANFKTAAGGGGSVNDLSGNLIKRTRPNRPAPFKPMGDAFRPGPYKGWR